MGKFWAFLFGVVMLACGLSFFAAPFMGWWLPPGESTHSDSVDFLFYIILYITGFFFFLTEGLLVYFMFVYTPEPGQPVRTTDASLPPELKALSLVERLVPKFLHHEHRVEMAWTIVPALILIYIAVAQINTWADVKYQSHAPQYGGPQTPMQIAVSARQFEWRMRYPSPERVEKWMAQQNLGVRDQKDYNSFPKTGQLDDVQVVNELHLWKKHPLMVHLTTRDVIHSFNLPHFRVKQDALPGREIPLWFTPLRANTKKGPNGEWLHGVDPTSGKAAPDLNWDIPCAELCGWGHYRMIGKVYVHETQEDFLEWLRSRAENPTPVVQGKQ